MDITTVENQIAALRALLEAQRTRVAADMRDYPTPVPACDADFNGLIDERIRLADAVVLLDALRESLFDRSPMADVWNEHRHGVGAAAGH